MDLYILTNLETIEINFSNRKIDKFVEDLMKWDIYSTNDRFNISFSRH